MLNSNEYRAQANIFRVHQNAVRPEPGPRDAAPPPLPRRSRRPDHLVHRTTPHRGHHRRGRRRENRRDPRRDRRAGRLPARHHLPRQPRRRRPRNPAPHRRRPRRRPQLLHLHRPRRRRPRRGTSRPATPPRPGHRREPPAPARTNGSDSYAHESRHGLRITLCGAPGRTTHPPATHAPGRPGRPGPTHRHALRHATDDRLRNRRLHRAPHHHRRPLRHPVHRRRRHRHPQRRPRLPPRDQQPRRPRPSTPSPPPTPPATPSSTKRPSAPRSPKPPPTNPSPPRRPPRHPADQTAPPTPRWGRFHFRRTRTINDANIRTVNDGSQPLSTSGRTASPGSTHPTRPRPGTERRPVAAARSTQTTRHATCWNETAPLPTGMPFCRSRPSPPAGPGVRPNPSEFPAHPGDR